MGEETTVNPLEKRLTDLENYVKNIHQLLFNSSFKEEAFRRVLFQKNVGLYNDFMVAIPEYQKFIEAIKSINETPKISEKISKVKDYNATNPLQMFVDDTDIPNTIEATGELSGKTYKSLVALPITDLLKEKLRIFQETVENAN